jgi:hypothetical protein
VGVDGADGSVLALELFHAVRGVRGAALVKVPPRRGLADGGAKLVTGRTARGVSDSSEMLRLVRGVVIPAARWREERRSPNYGKRMRQVRSACVCRWRENGHNIQVLHVR